MIATLRRRSRSLIGKRGFYIDLEKISCHKFATAMTLIAQIVVMLNFLPLQ
jgi:hypothetical protein